MIAETTIVAARRAITSAGIAVCYGTVMVRIDRLRWDPNNVGHIFRHGVRTNEVQEVVDGDSITRPGQRGRVLLTGPAVAGRMVTVVLEPEGGGVFYPVTARPASRKERREYQTEKAGEPP